MSKSQLTYCWSIDRLTFTPGVDEYLFTQDTKILYYGDGYTPGGRSVLKDELVELFKEADNDNLKFLYDEETQTIRAEINTSYFNNLIDKTKEEIKMNSENDLSVCATAFDHLIDKTKIEVIESTENKLNQREIELVSHVNDLLDEKLNDILTEVGVRVKAQISKELIDNLDLNSFDIVGNGDIAISGQLRISQPINGEISAIFYTTVYPDDSWIGLHTSRGTIETPSPVSLGDVLNGITINAHDGTDYRNTVLFGGAVDTIGSVSNGMVPGKFMVGTQSSAPDAVPGTRNYLTFDSLGQLSVQSVQAQSIQTGSYEAPTLYPSAPKAGTIIFDSGVKHFFGFDGTDWKQLDN